MKVNKSAFVRDLPPTMSAAEVVKLAASKGIKLSDKFVHTIRYNAKRLKGGVTSRARRGAAPKLQSGFQGALDSLVETAMGDMRAQADEHFAATSKKLVFDVLALVGAQPLSALSNLGAPAAPPAEKRSSRGAKRTPGEMDETIEAIVKMLRGKGDLSSEELQKHLGLSKAEIQRPLVLAVERKLVRKEGEKRSTRYFVATAKAAPAPKKARKVKAKVVAKPRKPKAKKAASRKPAPKKAAPKAKREKKLNSIATEPDAPSLKIAGA